MPISQVEFRLAAKARGYHLVTSEVLKGVGRLPDTGLLSLFVKHTSCGLTINENADPDVRVDFETFMNRLVPETNNGFIHTAEGPDDMPAHIKSSLLGCSVNVPITGGRLNLGTWQGVYLAEFRNHGGARKVVATIYH